jgi:carbonic anhydrase
VTERRDANRWEALRREFLLLTTAGGFGLTNFRLNAAEPQQAAPAVPPPLNPDEALRQLLAGNHRFTIGKPIGPRRGPKEFQALAHGQYPEAVIFSCADSRVAPEILFDVGVGDIFVVRVAGNVIDGAGVVVKGSIEYAVAELNVPLIVVLGHNGCGAVKAAIEHLNDSDSLPGAINGLVELIKPAVVKSKGIAGDPLYNAIRQNVEIGVERVRSLEPILAPRVKDGRVKVVGCVYDLRTGVVTVLDKEKIAA